MFALAQFTAVAVAGISMVAMVRSQASSTCSRTYTVQPGDYCDLISATQNVSTYQLATVNNATINAECTNLWVGEVLCLGLVGQDCTTVHVVASGEGCDTISAAAGITIPTLLSDNPNVNSGCTNIYPGEVLCTAPASS